MRAVVAAAFLAAGPAPGCEIALVLGFDVSSSIDPFEYRLQAEGIAGAFRDPEVEAALLEGRAAVALVQWSGLGEQRLALPWTGIGSEAELSALQARISALPRPWSRSDTAVGEALAFMTGLFDSAPGCRRQVIDFAGDGIANTGIGAAAPRQAALARGITINGLAIDRVGRSVTGYYRDHLAGGAGAFVVTATGFRDFARAFRAKLLRELVRPLS
jgi:Ca-activated chloride channel family protein